MPLIEGSPVQVPGKRYIMRNVGGVYDCSCIAWKMQSRSIDLRTCKHLCEYLGPDNERARVGNENMPTKYKLKEPDMTPPRADRYPDPKAPRIFPAMNPPSDLTSGDMSPALANRVAHLTAPTPKTSYPCLLAETYKDSDPTGWWMSEKLDGVRACWDGIDFRTRNNNILYAPDWFKAGMPAERLDGEFWLGRDMFQETMSIVRRHQANGKWKDIKYKVFDAQDAKGSFEDRMDHLRSLALPAHVVIVKQTKCTGKTHLEQELDRIMKLDGEGIMLRKPGSRYEACRSNTLLKVKPFRDMEVVVVGHTAGKGKHKGVIGALVCEVKGKTFNVGGGFTDKVRANPPAVGTMVTIKYQNLTKAGIPRHASFLRPYVEV